ncbi:MAG TPA: peptidylprolyl isomerase, partial [Vicinamibacterales bacterium]|nr:peptidylprolyl isomerase [Vicinamibacterales bacterium]
EYQQIQALKQQNRNVESPQELNDASLAALLAPVTPQILVSAVDELLLVQHGKEVPGAKFTEERFKAAIDGLKKANKDQLDQYAKQYNITPDQAFDALLKGEGMTMAQLRVRVERAFFVEVVSQKELAKSMNLTEEEARQYYNAHLDEFMKPATVTVREIFVNVPTTTINGQATVSAGADEDAKAKITAARERAIKGEDFAKLVEEISDSTTKPNGGLMGPVAENDLNPTIAEAIGKLKVGEISEPLRRAGGYQILKLETRVAAEPETLEKSKDAIAQKILEARLEVEKAKLIQKLLTQAVIEWKDDTYKQMYETERAARAKAVGAGK